MVYNTQNYWVFGLFPSSGIPENTTFRKLDLFPSSGEGGGEDTYSVILSIFIVLYHIYSVIKYNVGVIDKRNALAVDRQG
jgi:hypothetical protein